MNKLLFFFLGIIILIGVFLVSREFVYLPADILYTFPHFKETYGFTSPHNSLLADPVVQFEPWRVYAKQRLLTGEIPHLNDYSGLGAPFLANPQTAVFYPLTILYYLLPVNFALLLIHFLKYILFFIFSYVYFRSVFVEKRFAFVGGLLLAISPFFIMWNMWPHTNVYLIFPLLLFCVEKIRQGEHRYRYFSLLSIGICIGFFGGHPETLFLLCVFLSLYIFFRLFFSIRLIGLSFLFIAVGFLLSSVQLIPFLEYLFHSRMLFERSMTSHDSGLPIGGIIFLFVPFLLGSPHAVIYKPVLSSNFQELSGGFVGISMLLFGILSLITIKKNSLSWFWITVCIISFGMTYGIFPFNLVEDFPVFNVSANHRFSAFFGFALTVFFILFLTSSIRKKHVFSLQWILIFGSVPLGYILFFLFLKIPYLPESYLKYISFHMSVYIFTFFLSILFLTLFLLKKKTRYLLLLLMTLVLQVISLFGNYNTFVEKTDYYPRTQLTSVLSALPGGSVLEVGNTVFHENSNIVYGIPSIENYDALEINSFNATFSRYFPEKNHWGNVDEVTQEGLNRFGIMYVIADYDIRTKKNDRQTDGSDVLFEIVPGSDTVVSFSTDDFVSGIRILPATFNRDNTCDVRFILTNSENIRVVDELIPCSSFTNNYFFTVSFPPQKSRTFTLTLSSDNATYGNAVALYGKNGIAHFSVLSPQQNDFLDLIAKGETWYLFKNLTGETVSTRGTYGVMTNEPEKIMFVHSSETDETISVKRAYYPGWKMEVDGQREQLTKNPLLSGKIPKGEHLVTFTYVPYTFYVGSVISVITLICLGIFYLRYEQRNISQFVLNHVIERNHIRQTTWSYHLLALSISFLLSCTIILICVISIPIQFESPQTRVINWISVTDYPKTQDIVGFFILFPILFLLTFLFWLVWIKLKKHS